MHDFKRKPPQAIDARKRIIDKLSNEKYHLLTVEDQIDYTQIKNKKIHQYTCHQIARQLSALLALTTAQFFYVLQAQASLEDADYKEKAGAQQNKESVFRLRACVESCLEIFSRRAYLMLDDLYPDQKEKTSCKYWEKFKEIVLMVLMRMSLGCSSEYKIILMNGWYLDCCKLLDICLIYGFNYKRAVTELIRNVLAKGAELDDFQKDFHRVLELIYLKTKEICQEFEGFAQIDFTKLQNNSQLYQNYLNAEKTLTKSLLKTLFSTYDLLRNLQAIVEFFPSRCKVRLLQHVLLFKRFIMIYNKLRYYDDAEWSFGVRESLFRPFINFLRTTIISFLTNTLAKIAMLIKNLPAASPYRPDLKRTFANFWYFTLLTPAVSFEYRQNETRLERAKHHGRELATLIVKEKAAELFQSEIIQHFSKQAETYQAIIVAMNISKQITEQQQRKIALDKMEGWRLPSFANFLKSAFPKLGEGINLKQYNDEPIYDEQEQQVDYTTLDSAEQSYLSECFKRAEETQASQQEKTERTATDKRGDDELALFDQLQLSSIGNNNSQHYCSGALSDSVVIQGDSLETVSAILKSTE